MGFFALGVCGAAQTLMLRQYLAARELLAAFSMVTMV
jgi:hypothetical protein